MLLKKFKISLFSTSEMTEQRRLFVYKCFHFFSGDTCLALYPVTLCKSLFLQDVKIIPEFQIKWHHL